MKRILFLTSNSLATNPRLVKELELASQKFDCTTFSFALSNWSDSIDAELRSSFPKVLFRILSAGKKPFLPWFFSSILERVAKVFYPYYSQSLLLSSLAHSKRSYLLWSALLDHKGKYDLVIAHNLAALYPAYRYAKENNIPFAFDVEDYHPGEKIDKDIKNERTRREYLMKSLLPAAYYVSYASPLIGRETLNILPHSFHSNLLLINNSFSSKEFKRPKTTESRKLNFVWFSQNVSSGRGLEQIIPVLDEFKEDIHLTLIGNINTAFYNSFLKKYSDFVSFEKPVLQLALHKLLAAFDIGLAVEFGVQDFNRELCLTNKLFAYTQAGLFILATNTQAQSMFLEENPWAGIITGNTPTEIRETVKRLILDKVAVRKNAVERFEKSKALAWEKEQNKLVAAWESLVVLGSINAR